MCLILFYDMTCPSTQDLSELPEPDRAAFTWDTSRFHEADAVVFQPSGLGRMRPAVRPAGQIWVLWLADPLDCDLAASDPECDRAFDLTMGFQRGADIWHHPVPARRAWAAAVTAAVPVKTDAATAIMVLSSERNASGRLGYVSELMRYLRIDSFGSISNNRPDGVQDDAGRSSIGHYSFCIAAEDAICDDYVSDALYRPLLAGTVPIYLGARNVAAFVPDEDCVVDVRKFAGLRRLAEHVSALVRDPAAYRRHLAWRDKPFRPEFERLLDRPAPLSALLDAVRSRLGPDRPAMPMRWTFDRTPRRAAAAPAAGTALRRWLTGWRDPFAAWTDAARERSFRLLARVAWVAQGCGAVPFLFGETLLGHVRQGGPLPWARHLDLAWCPEGPGDLQRLRSALIRAGLRVQDQDWLAIGDPADDLYLGRTEARPILHLHAVGPGDGAEDRVPRALLLPGRPADLAGVTLREPEAPLAVLDWTFGDWRSFETAAGRTRPVVTDSRGRKDRAATIRLRAPAHGDAFAPVWDTVSLDRQRLLLQRVTTASERCGIRLFLFWGTLIGHMREGRILPWDDDLDLAFFDPGEGQHARLRQALQEEGLRTHDHEAFGPTMKVYDLSYEAGTGHPWTWPMIDMFPFPLVPDASEAERSEFPVPRDLVLPGRRVRFEGSDLWEPERPLALLDLHYPGWRSVEVSSPYDHRIEAPNWPVLARRIATDESGRKLGAGS